MTDGDDDRPPTYGLFLNMGRNLGVDAAGVVALTLEQAAQAEDAGFQELWVTEHHFIPFGINPSALTAAAFLLGRTTCARVGTAVTLSPLHNPIELAERGALLDQLSGGRFELGLGRGGYLKDYEVLGVDTARWDDEPLHSARTVLDAWRNPDLTQPEHTTGPSTLQPPVLTTPHPPLLMATRSESAIRFAAQNKLPLQHYFASPVRARLDQEQIYRDASSSAVDPAHLHTMIVVVDGDEEATRRDLTTQLTQSFRDGDWPHVPQGGPGHVDANGRPVDRAVMARSVAEGAIIGPAGKVRDEIERFRATTGANRLAFYVEAIADPARIRTTIDALGTHLLK
ncbi:MAG: LLM class flavin-dependent oxidoreductase [Actinomycetota bacterium]